MVSATGDGEGRTWERGDQVMLLRDWLGVRRSTVGTVLNLLEKRQSSGTILLVEWSTGGGWMSIDDDLVERLPPRAELHD
jgi:hypothetical protein